MLLSAHLRATSKVFYLVNSNRRFTNERANLSYGVAAFFLAETIVTCLAQLLWVPGCSLAFFMVGRWIVKELSVFFSLAKQTGAAVHKKPGDRFRGKHRVFCPRVLDFFETKHFVGSTVAAPLLSESWNSESITL